MKALIALVSLAGCAPVPSATPQAPKVYTVPLIAATASSVGGFTFTASWDASVIGVTWLSSGVLSTEKGAAGRVASGVVIVRGRSDTLALVTLSKKPVAGASPWRFDVKQASAGKDGYGPVSVGLVTLMMGKVR